MGQAQDVAGLALEVSVHPAAAVQVLQLLCDNACKSNIGVATCVSGACMEIMHVHL